MIKFQQGTTSSYTPQNEAAQRAAAYRRAVQRSQPRVSKPVYHAPKPVYHAPKPVYHAPKVVSALSQPKPAPSAADILKQQEKAYEDKLKQYYSQYENSQVNNFKAARDKAIGQYNSQIDNTKQQYHGLMDQANVKATQGAERLRELMANAGLTSSGENITANVGLNASRDNALNQLRVGQGQQVGALQQQIADANNPDKLNALKQQIEAQKAQALAGAYQHVNDQAFNQNQFDQTMGWNFWNAKHQDAAAAAQAAAQIQQYKNMIAQLGGNFPNGSGGGGYQSDLAQAVQRAHIPASQLPAFNWIIKNESGFNPNAQNPNSTAHGYGQFLNSTVRNYENKTGLNYNNPTDQLIMAYQYMVDRYGSPQAAMDFWQRHHWY